MTPGGLMPLARLANDAPVVHVVEGADGVPLEIRVHLPNGFPGAMPSGFDSRPPPTTPGLPSPGSSGLLPPVRLHAGAMPTPSNMPGGSREGSPPPTAVGPASPVSPPPHVAEALLRLEQEHLAAEELLRDSFARRRSGVERGVIVHGTADHV